jgi:hypothetical protein
MKKLIFLLLIIFLITPSSASLKFNDLNGRWRLIYGGNYGYEFRFHKSFRALCILYLRSNAHVFKGVYTIEEGNKIRINISEMKNEQSSTSINMNKNFVKTSSSYFIFEGEIKKSKNKKILELKPIKIIIDSNDSDGYFEPLLKLEKN